ncbi:unnamed protein product [Rangifer tarandus platyrhynchus]|uniref:Uncharacterized protein n=1 Tax=Rangifer tarandus platyrhynchus TaxID=3082113 RepID=A0AC59ZAA8_RANTA
MPRGGSCPSRPPTEPQQRQKPGAHRPHAPGPSRRKTPLPRASAPLPSLAPGGAATPRPSPWSPLAAEWGLRKGRSVPRGAEAAFAPAPAPCGSGVSESGPWGAQDGGGGRGGGGGPSPAAGWRAAMRWYRYFSIFPRIMSAKQRLKALGRAWACEDPSLAEIRPQPWAGSPLPSAPAQLTCEKQQFSGPDSGCAHPGPGGRPPPPRVHSLLPPSPLSPAPRLSEPSLCGTLTPGRQRDSQGKQEGQRHCFL